MSFKMFLFTLFSLISSFTIPVLAQKIPGSFIVQLNGNCNQQCRGTLQSALTSNRNTAVCNLGPRGSKIGSLTFEYIKCPPFARTRESTVAAVITAKSRVGSVPVIQIVAQDRVVTTTGPAPHTLIWNVDEADGGVKRKNGIPVRDGLRTCNMTSNNGAGVNVWILDTGCFPTYDGFCEGYYGGSNVCKDNEGHGNHVGGTATNPMVGVAPRAVRSCVKVLSDSGAGTWENVIKGIEFAANNRNKFGKGDVINMSLGANKFDAVNNAVREASRLGVYFAIAAGNDADNACNYSPASTTGRGIFTVQAHDEGLHAAHFTNYATSDLDCTDLSAPGVDISSSGGSKSGTSMASPHVAGACAILLSDDLAPTRSRLTAKSVWIHISGALSRRTTGLACSNRVSGFGSH